MKSDVDELIAVLPELSREDLDLLLLALAWLYDQPYKTRSISSITLLPGDLRPLRHLSLN